MKVHVMSSAWQTFAKTIGIYTEIRDTGLFVGVSRGILACSNAGFWAQAWSAALPPTNATGYQSRDNNRGTMSSNE